MLLCAPPPTPPHPRARTFFAVQVDRGASLSGLSQYPHEEETLLPPLTSQEQLDMRIDGGTLVVDMRLNVNMNSLCLEEVLAKRRNLVREMSAQMKRDMVLRPAGWLALQAALDASGGDSIDVVEYAAGALSRMLEPGLAENNEVYSEDSRLGDAIAFAINAKQASDLPRGFAALCACDEAWNLENIHTVAEFNLKNLITEQADAPCAGGALALLLRRHGRISGIDLSWIRIGSGGCVALAEAIALTNSLEWLKLDTTQVGDAGARALAKALTSNTSLSYLDLWGAEITSVGAIALADALPQNGTLGELELRANWIDDKAVGALIEAIRHTPTLRRLGLLESSISDEGIAQLSQAAAERKATPLQLDICNTSYSQYYDEQEEKAEKGILGGAGPHVEEPDHDEPGEDVVLLSPAVNIGI
jgi:hypothetical protein